MCLSSVPTLSTRTVRYTIHTRRGDYDYVAINEATGVVYTNGPLPESLFKVQSHYFQQTDNMICLIMMSTVMAYNTIDTRQLQCV